MRSAGLFMILFFCLSPFLVAQSSDVDSLQQALEIATEDTSRALLHCEISSALYRSKPDLAKDHWDSALAIIQKNKESDNLQEKRAFLRLEIRAKNGLAILASRGGQYQMAINYYLENLSTARREGFIQEIVIGQQNLAALHIRLGKFNKAIDYYQKAVVGRKLEKNWKKVVVIYQSIGRAFHRQKQRDSADYYHHMAYQLAVDHKFQKGISNYYNRKGIIYRQEKRYDSALFYFEKVEKILKPLHLNILLTINHLNIASCLVEAGDYHQAEKNCSTAIQLSEKGKFMSLLIRAYELMSEIKERQGNHEQAYFYYNQYEKKHDSIFNANIIEEVSRKEIAFTYQQQMVTDSIANAKKETQLRHEIEKEKLNNWRRGIFIVCFLLLAGMVIYLLIRKNYIHHQKIKLQETEIALEKEKNERQTLEKIKLEYQLKEKKQDIVNLASNNALKLQLKKELLEEIQSILKSDTPQMPELLQKLLFDIEGQVDAEEEAAAWKGNLEDANELFLLKLIEKHPNLSKAERLMSLYVLLDLSIKEIAELKKASTGSVKVTLHRLRKKLNITTSQELFAYLRSL